MCATVNDSTPTGGVRQVLRQEFLNYLYGGLPRGMYFELTFIAPPGVSVPGPRIFTESYALGREAPDWHKVDALNADGYGVYYGLTPKRRRVGSGQRSSERDAALCQVLWVDVDLADGVYASKADAVAGICHAIHMPPGCMVDSGGGVHALWVIDPVTVTADTLPTLKATLRGVAKAVRGDTSVSDLARVFRLPDTTNTKPERHGARCAVIDLLPHVSTLAEFARYADMRPAPPPRVTVTLPEDARLSLPRWTQDYLVHGAPRGERNNRLYAAAIEYRVNGYSRADADRDLIARARADGLDDDEAQRTITSAWTSPHGTPNLPPHMAARLAAYKDDEL